MCLSVNIECVLSFGVLNCSLDFDAVSSWGIFKVDPYSSTILTMILATNIPIGLYLNLKITDICLRYSSPMTASDCYNLALMLYKKEGLYTRAAEWFKAALGKLNNEQNENTLTIADVMSYIVKSYHHSNIYLGWLLLQNKNVDKESNRVCQGFKILFLKFSFLWQTQKPTSGQRNYML